nr:MAG TPA: hypothetical protein [Caudoviricetes sp.]
MSYTFFLYKFKNCVIIKLKNILSKRRRAT